MLDDKPRMRADEIPFGEEHLYQVVEPVPRVYDQVPPGLEVMVPGPVLAGVAVVDRCVLGFAA